MLYVHEFFAPSQCLKTKIISNYEGFFNVSNFSIEKKLVIENALVYVFTQSWWKGDQFFSKIYRAIFEITVATFEAFSKRNFAKQCEISGTACCENFRKLFLSSVVVRHHSMKVWCNFNRYWWRTIIYVMKSTLFETLRLTPTLIVTLRYHPVICAILRQETV